MHAIAKT